MHLNKVLFALFISASLISCNTIDLIVRCDYFNDQEWVKTTLTQAEQQKLNDIYPLDGQEYTAWFRNKNEQIGLCKYTETPITTHPSCGSWSTIFIEVNGVFKVEKEHVTVCGSYRRYEPNNA